MQEKKYILYAWTMHRAWNTSKTLDRSWARNGGGGVKGEREKTTKKMVQLEKESQFIWMCWYKKWPKYVAQDAARVADLTMLETRF